MSWLDILFETLEISILIFFLMVLVEIIELKYSGLLKRYFVERGSLRYILPSIISAIPGCSGTFLMDTLYMAGIAGFGGIVSAMIATTGDEAFLLISLAANSENSFSWNIVLSLFASLIFLGIVGGWVADKVVKKFSIKVAQKCEIDKHDNYDVNKINWPHFFKDHMWSHIIKNHLIRILLWVAFSLIIMKTMSDVYQLEESITNNAVIFLIFAGIVGFIPLSGPHVVIITFFVEGLVPFSVLLTNAIVQEGHGMLPLLGFSLEDSFKIKLFKLIFAYIIGFALLSFGL